jgi:transposase
LLVLKPVMVVAFALANRMASKDRLGRISKAGNRYLRRLLYLGALAQIAWRRRGRPGPDWLGGMLERKPVKVVAVALANRMARIVWAPIRTGQSYQAAPA